MPTTNYYQIKVIDPGDQTSKLAKEIGFNSHDNNDAVEIIPHQPGNFRGAVGWRWKDNILEAMLAKKVFSEVENDGSGGKSQFLTLIGTKEVFYGAGNEIITMTADDMARSGRFPAIMVNDLNVKTITDRNFHLIKALFEGYGQALKDANLVNITGETAVMKHSITAFCEDNPEEQLIFTWGGSCFGLSHQAKMIDGSKITAGMPIVGLWEPGYRCNGGTFFTNIILEYFGPNIEKILNNPDALNFIKKLCVPSRSYAKSICRIHGWNADGSICDPLARIYGIAHITGGGVWGKFGELLPAGVGANLFNMPIPAEVLLEAQELSWKTKFKLPDWQAYGTLHGGCGMMIVVHPSDLNLLTNELEKDGISAEMVGETTNSTMNEVIIKSRFKEGKELSSLKPE